MNAPLPKLGAIPREAAAVGDYEALARERVDANAWAYIGSGAAD